MTILFWQPNVSNIILFGSQEVWLCPLAQECEEGMGLCRCGEAKERKPTFMWHFTADVTHIVAPSAHSNL